jgi:hypothetical protein
MYSCFNLVIFWQVEAGYGSSDHWLMKIPSSGLLRYEETPSMMPHSGPKAKKKKRKEAAKLSQTQSNLRINTSYYLTHKGRRIIQTSVANP